MPHIVLKKIYIDINIRTVRDGGRNDKNILHGPAVKVKYNKDLIDIFIKHKNNSNDYYCEIDRKYDKRKADKFISDKSYKIISKFCLKNAKEICKIWDTREGSEEYNKLMDTIKKNNPEFNYQ